MINKDKQEKVLIEMNNAIETKLQKDRERLYEKYIAMYNVTKTFLRDKGLLLYGGLAINLTLPKEKRFYDQYELPDYDFLSYSAIEHAKELADIYHSLGYQYIEVRPGIHNATYKIYVDFMAVADITDIPLRLFEYLHELALGERDVVLKNNPSLDINIVPLSFLRLAFHIELSRPDGYIERWPKIYKRMVIFYNTYPLHYEHCDNIFVDEDNSRVPELVKIIMNFARSHGNPIFGIEALKIYLKHHGTKVPPNTTIDLGMSQVDLITLDLKKTTTEIYTIVSSMLDIGERLEVKYHSPLNKSEFISRHSIITLITNENVERRICTIYSSQACFAYKVVDGYNLLTIDSILSHMYAFLFSRREYLISDKIKCMINIFLNIQGHHLQSDKYIWKRFDLLCYGIQPQILDVKRARWDSRKTIQIYRPENKRPTTTTSADGSATKAKSKSKK